MAVGKKSMQEELERLLAEQRKLAKRANQRMVRLEKAAKKQKYNKVLEYSYKSAQKDISNLKKMIDPSAQMGAGRFRESGKRIKGLTDNQMIKYLRSAISAEKEFLESITSTIGDVKGKEGIASLYDRRTETINKKYGTNFTADELQRFFASRKQSKLESMYGSGQMFQIADTIKNQPKTKRAMKEYLQKHITIQNYEIDTKNYKSAKDMYQQLQPFLDETGDDILNHFIGEAVLKEGFNFASLFI